jgi:hypothetical protein
MTNEYPGKFRFRFPCDSSRVRERAYFRDVEGKDASAEQNWLVAEAEEMALSFADAWGVRLHSLSPELDRAFQTLYERWAFGAATLQAGTVNWPDFADAVGRFLDGVARGRRESSGILDQYFKNFTGIWQTLFWAQRFAEADDIWGRAVDCVVQWERRPGSDFVHKGSGFFYWGSNQLLAGDHLRGFTLMHESLREDEETHKTQMPQTPSSAVAMLDFERLDLPEPSRTWVKGLAVYVRTRIEASGGSLSLAEFQRRFLAAPVDWSRTFSLVYTMAALRRVHHHPEAYRTSDFAGQAALDLFFNLAVVLECAVGDKNRMDYGKTRPTFIHQAEYLLEPKPAGTQWKKNSGPTWARLGTVNGRFDADFGGTLGQLLDRSFRFAPGTPGEPAPSDDERSVFLAYGIRNRGGHDTASAEVVWQRFDDLLNSLLAAQLLCVKKFY